MGVLRLGDVDVPVCRGDGCAFHLLLFRVTEERAGPTGQRRCWRATPSRAAVGRREMDRAARKPVAALP